MCNARKCRLKGLYMITNNINQLILLGFELLIPRDENDKDGTTKQYDGESG